MKQRSKTKQSMSRSVRRDTKVATIEKKYGVDLGVRSDMTLGTYLIRSGYPSLSSLLKSTK